MSDEFRDRLLAELKNKFKIGDIAIHLPPQGMSSSVFFAKLSEQRVLAVKYGKDAMLDVPIYEMIVQSRLDIPIPRLYESFIFEGVPVVLLEKINYPLLETIPNKELPLYIPSMIENLRKLHIIKSDTPGAVDENERNKNWKDIMLGIFQEDVFNWDEVVKRDCLDKKLILSSISKIKDKINNIHFIEKGYSLLHTDFNQRNLFVNPQSSKITGIIDWEGAIFGDPIYDFARVRMFIWHFNLGEDAVKSYYDIMNFNFDENKLEDLYWLSRIIQYLGWYSEELNEFNLGRIELHQKYLREYKW